MVKQEKIDEKKCLSNCKEADYLGRIFTLLKMQDRLIFREGKTRFNNTEFRMIGEIISAKYEGKRLISTQLATRLGVTRSAISQIVNRLEGQGIVQRIPDAVDKKIAYIELSKEIIDQYDEDLQNAFHFVGTVVPRFGEERFYRMCDDFDAFISIVESNLEKSEKR